MKRKLKATIGLLVMMAALVSFEVACTKSQLVASGNDIVAVVSVQALIDAVAALSPTALADLLRVTPLAKELVTAIQNGNSTTAAGLVAEIFPVIENIAKSFNANPKIMALLALADIALKFLVNHLPPAPVVASATQRKLGALKSERAWGCDYLPADKRCKELAH
jgi:hypothetical protein